MLNIGSQLIFLLQKMYEFGYNIEQFRFDHVKLQHPLIPFININGTLYLSCYIILYLLFPKIPMRERRLSHVKTTRNSELHSDYDSDIPVRTFYFEQRNTFRQSPSELDRLRNQFNTLQKNFRRRRHSNLDLVTVRSKQQQILMRTFLSPDKQVVLTKPKKDLSPLSNILRKRSKYKTKYFQDIQKARKNMSKVHLKELDPIEIGKWTLRSVLGKGYILVRASNGAKQICRKYMLCDPPAIVENYYKDWLKEKFDWMN